MPSGRQWLRRPARVWPDYASGVLILALFGCSLLTPPLAGEPAPAPTAEVAPSPPPAEPVATPPEPALITDEECVARGGRVVTEETYAYLRRRRDPDHRPAPFRVCRVPSPKNGAACAGEADCGGGRCFCAGELGRPDADRDPALAARDGQPAAGRCSDSPLPSGSWFCLVVDGKARLNGIIVD